MHSSMPLATRLARALLMALALSAAVAHAQAQCTVASDCAPAQCCHPTSCVPVSQVPNCAAQICTMDCRGGTMDCGAGHCACSSNGTCVAEYGTPTPPAAGTCAADADYVASTCCHSTTCVHRSRAPACTGVACTEICQLGTVQCDGRCACTSGGTCANVLRSSPPSSLTSGAASHPMVTAAVAVATAVLVVLY